MRLPAASCRDGRLEARAALSLPAASIRPEKVRPNSVNNRFGLLHRIALKRKMSELPQSVAVRISVTKLKAVNYTET